MRQNDVHTETVCELKEIKEIPRMINVVFNKLDILGCMAENIQDKLSPILSLPLPVDNQKKQESETGPLLVIELIRMKNKIENIINTLSDIQDRIEL